MELDRRARPRADARGSLCIVRVASPGGRPQALAVPEDVSAGGARLVASRPQPPGTALLLELEGVGGGPLPFLVTRCEGLAGGGYSVAGAFTPEITQGQADALASG